MCAWFSGLVPVMRAWADAGVACIATCVVVRPALANVTAKTTKTVRATRLNPPCLNLIATSSRQMRRHGGRRIDSGRHAEEGLRCDLDPSSADGSWELAVGVGFQRR
jgi:hypothetical protein